MASWTMISAPPAMPSCERPPRPRTPGCSRSGRRRRHCCCCGGSACRTPGAGSPPTVRPGTCAFRRAAARSRRRRQSGPAGFGTRPRRAGCDAASECWPARFNRQSVSALFRGSCRSRGRAHTQTRACKPRDHSSSTAGTRCRCELRRHKKSPSANAGRAPK